MTLTELKKLAEAASKGIREESFYLNAANPATILTLLSALEKYEEALKFYSSKDAMSCRLRKRFIDTPKCLEGDSDYFQDPADLPIVQDGGEKAKEALTQVQKIMEGK